MNKLKLLSSSFIMALTLAAPFATYAMDPEEDHQPARPSRPFNIHTYMALSLGLAKQHMDPIYHSIPELHPDHPNHYVYKRFLQGRLVYKPNEDSDEGMVVLPIADLPNPLNGEFDLSQCDDAGKYLSIYTGYREGKNPENEGKVEIWIAPRFLIENNLKESASHFKDIMGSWDPLTAPVGTFFTWGSWDDLKYYDYATNLSWESYNAPENNLGIIHLRTLAHYAQVLEDVRHIKFSCHF